MKEEKLLEQQVLGDHVQGNYLSRQLDLKLIGKWIIIIEHCEFLEIDLIKSIWHLTR